ncbi:uncharacterized protein LOC143461044 [Clavelina lepadiformis]|uniref:uncharacterized protein LOC143461044 n=1 Tax=Clavelina lepadiformis TaxID=159417 RepID=UPI0040430CBB
MSEASSSAEAENPIVVCNADEIFCNSIDYILGRGVHGLVFLGFHPRSGNRLVIKCLLPEKSGRATDIARSSLIKELQVFNLVKNKHVVHIQGLLDWKGCPFGLVMEHMPGGSLQDLIFHPALGRIPPHLLLRIGYDVSDGLSHLHTILKDCRNAHGDLKPANILLTADLRCKVAVFGGAALARYTGSLGAGLDKPGEGNQLSHYFAAPERLVPGCNRLTTAMEVYSYGLILLVAICRVYPSVFHSTQKQEMINNFKQHLQSKGDGVGVEITTMLETILCKCLDLNPKNCPSMTKVKSELFTFLQTIDEGEMQGCVAEICRQIRIRDDKLDEKNCKTISEVIAGLEANPVADQIDKIPSARLNNDVKHAVAVKRKNSEKTSNVAERESNNDKCLLKYSDHGSTYNFQSVMNLLQSVRCFITERNFDNALKRCKELLFVTRSINLRAKDSEMLTCDVIYVVKNLAEEKPSLILLELIEVAKQKLIVTTPVAQLKFILKFARCTSMIARYYDVRYQKNISSRVLEFVGNLTESMSSLPCEDKEMVVKAKASCWKCKAECYGYLDNRGREMELYLQVITLIDKELGEKCQMSTEYSASCNNLANNYELKDQLEMAKTYILKSFDALAYQKTDFETEESKVKAINITIRNVCNLYEKSPSMMWRKVSEIYRYLQTQQHPSKFRQLETRVLSLRLALLLNVWGDAGIHYSDVIKMLNKPSLTPGMRLPVCFDIRSVAMSYIHHNQDHLAIPLLQYGLSMCKLISNPFKKLAQLLHFSDCIVNRVNEPTFKSAQQIAIIKSSFIPLCRETIYLTKECRGVDDFNKQIYLSLQLKQLSHCYLQADNFPQSLAKANEALRILPEDPRKIIAQRDGIVGELNMIIGVCTYNLGHCDLGKSTLEKAMEVLKDTNKAKYNIALEYLTYWEKRRK